MTATTTQTMKIIVFGASGEVGRSLVAEAASRGHRVSAVSRREPSPGTHALFTFERSDRTVVPVSLEVRMTIGRPRHHPLLSRGSGEKSCRRDHEARPQEA